MHKLQIQMSVVSFGENFSRVRKNAGIMRSEMSRLAKVDEDDLARIDEDDLARIEEGQQTPDELLARRLVSVLENSTKNRSAGHATKQGAWEAFYALTDGWLS